MSLFAKRAFLHLGLLVVGVWAVVVSANAQVAGRNVNMVSGGTFPGGDPHLQKQNEPSLAMSTRNPCHILAGANDYRAVDLPGLPDDLEIGDAWLGWYESTDCGATWYSTLVPGYPQDTSPEGLASPVKGLQAGADPVVRAGAAGTFYYLFLAFNRDQNASKLAVARAIDHNDRDTFVDPNALPISADGKINPRRALSPIQYVGTTEIRRGNELRFIDKPSLAVFPEPVGTCKMDGETVPATTVYAAWTEFVGEDHESTNVFIDHSHDCGKTFHERAKLSRGNSVGQGTAIAVNPKNPYEIMVVWRQVRDDTKQDALLFARSTDGGTTFSNPEFVKGFGEGEFRPFDQNTTSKSGGNLTTTFRTVAYPSLAFADDGYVYLAVSQVPSEFHTPGQLGGAQARIYMTRAQGPYWYSQPRRVVEDTDAAGQQFMPSLAYAAGKMQLVWYDVRFDEAFEPSQLTSKPLIDDAEAIAAAARRRTIDLLGAQASFSVSPHGQVSTVWPPAFTRYGVSQPDYNDVENNAIPSRGPRVSQYLTGDPQPAVNQTPAGARQLQFNRGGLELYGGGTVPFIGDYVDVAPIAFVFNAKTRKWVFNGAANATKASLQTFQAAWTDNRDALVSKAQTEPLPSNPLITRFKYERPLLLNGGVLSDASCPVPGVDNTRSRDANVYTSRITQDFSFTAPSNSKHNAAGVIRAFAVQLTNNHQLDPNAADPPTTYTLTIDPTARASFSRRSFQIVGQACVDAPAPDNVPVRQITVNVLPRGSIARTIYVPCGVTGPIAVTATDTSTGAAGSVLINGDPANPGAKGPDGAPLGPESHNPEIENPGAENPEIENPEIENPEIENPEIENPGAENPEIENPEIENPEIENPEIENPEIENPEIENASFQDISTDVTNDGDTTSGYQVQAGAAGDTTGYQFLLIGRRVYSTPTSIRCHLVQRNTNQMLFSIPLDEDDLSNGAFFEENDESEKHPTFLVRPGESIRVTLRVVYNRATTPQFCSADPSSSDWCFNRVSIRTQAQAPNTGELEPREDVEGSFADLTVGGVLTAPPVAGMGGFIDMPKTTIQNEGNVAADPDGTFRWDYYRSSDPEIDGSEGDRPFRVGESADSLPADSSITFGPRRLVMPFTANQSWYLGIFTDADNTVPEGSESNNSLVTPAAVTIVPYFSSIDVQFRDPDNPDSVTTATVAVFQFNGPQQDSSSVPGATVAFALERPIAPSNEPGIPENGFQVMTGVTNADGRVTFVLPNTLPGEGNFRFVATVSIVGVAAPLKFQSVCFGCIQ